MIRRDFPIVQQFQTGDLNAYVQFGLYKLPNGLMDGSSSFQYDETSRASYLQVDGLSAGRVGRI
jgi:hypothetical protein